MNPECGGIQSTSYEFFKIIGREFEVCGYSATLPDKYKDARITETPKTTKLNTLKWIVQHSNKNTCNIVMNCWFGLPAIIAKILCGAHYFVLAHGNDVYEFSKKNNSIKRNLLLKINKIILKSADFVACNSIYTRKLLGDVVSDDKCFIIHPPCKQYDAHIDEKIEKNSVFSIGRLVQRKGFQYVIEAISILKKDYPDIHYYLAGEGPYKRELEQLVSKLRLNNNISFLGKIDDETKIAYYSKCEVFTMPSIELQENNSVEGFGIVFIEANQFGKFVIASNSGGVPDAVIEGITGVTLDTISGQKIAAEIAKVFSESKYNSEVMILERKKWAEKHYTDEIIKEYYNAMRICKLL